MVTDIGEGLGEWTKWVKRVKRYKLPLVNKSWGCDIQHDDYSQYFRAYLKAAKRINPKV